MALIIMAIKILYVEDEIFLGKIVFETQMVNVAEVLQEGVTTYPDIVVMNFMKAKHDKYKSYEDLEKSMTE